MFILLFSIVFGWNLQSQAFKQHIILEEFILELQGENILLRWGLCNCCSFCEIVSLPFEKQNHFSEKLVYFINI